MQPVSRYVVAMCRPHTESTFSSEGGFRRDQLSANVSRYCGLIADSARKHGARLIAFPEFELTGYAPLASDLWEEAGLTFPGPEIEPIAQAARAAGAYVVIQAMERHAAFPGRYFMSAALLTPAGEIGLVHRKSYAMSLRTSPNDVHDRFVEVFGREAFFPVLETPLGKIGLSIGAEPHWPEAIRALALKGCELVINPVASAPLIDYMGRPGAEGVRSVRAFENLVYLGMSNIGTEGAAASQVYDFNGAAIGRSADADGVVTLAELDMEALRRARTAPKANFLAQIQTAIHEPLESLPLWPPNTFAETAAADVEQLYAVETEVWRRMQTIGRGKAPAA